MNAHKKQEIISNIKLIKQHKAKDVYYALEFIYECQIVHYLIKEESCKTGYKFFVDEKQSAIVFGVIRKSDKLKTKRSIRATNLKPIYKIFCLLNKKGYNALKQ